MNLALDVESEKEESLQSTNSIQFFDLNEQDIVTIPAGKKRQQRNTQTIPFEFNEFDFIFLYH